MEDKEKGNIENIVLSAIKPNPNNSRSVYAGTDFEDFVESVRKVGVIQPILIKPLKKSGTYEIVFGERRWRACCKIAEDDGIGIDNATIPAIIKVMSDKEAFKIMTIENLQRENLTPLEEAKSFKSYRDKEGKEGLKELAESIGKSLFYIQRRIMVLSLPAKALKAWEKGKIGIGHLEQLCRVKDKSTVNDYLVRLLAEDGSRIETVKELKEYIDQEAIILKAAKFDTTECSGCQSNTEYQRQLFEEDCKGVQCTNASCFKKKQEAFLEVNWSKIGKQFGTNGFRFCSDIDKHQGFGWRGNYGERCKDCASFVTLLDIEGKAVYDFPSCIGDQSCYDEVIKESRRATKEASGSKGSSPRLNGLNSDGNYFRELFYQNRIPQSMSLLGVEDIRCLQISLMSSLKSNNDGLVLYAKQWLPEEYGGKENLVWYNILFSDVWKKIMSMTADELRQAQRDIAGCIVMQNGYSAQERHMIAKLLDIDLSQEWRITEEYLKKKTKNEILNLIKRFNIENNEKATAFLYESLGKKRGRFDTCGKSELISIFLESGIDLKGMVPEEILEGGEIKIHG